MSGCCAAEKDAPITSSSSTEISSPRLTSAAPDRLGRCGVQDWQLRHYRVRAPRKRPPQSEVSLPAQIPQTTRECGDRSDRSRFLSSPLRKARLTWHFAPGRSRLPHAVRPELLFVLGSRKRHPL